MSSRLAFTHMDVGYEDNAGAIIFPWLLASYDHHGWWKCRYCICPWIGFSRAIQEQLSRSKYLPVHPVHSSLLVFTHMDVGYEDNAGAIIFPWHRDIPYILYIAAPPSMAPCVIPYILYIKKPSEEGLLLKHLLLFLIRNRSLPAHSGYRLRIHKYQSAQHQNMMMHKQNY